MKILQAQYVISAPRLRDCPDFEGTPEFVLVGRSNVGKSSFINTMTLRKNLARTSNTPGKTRYINFYDITYGDPSDENAVPERLLFVDLPGYGYAKVSKAEQEKWRKYLEEYLLKRESLRLVIQLIDARHGPQQNDLQMLEWLKLNELPVLIVLTKTDKLSRNEAAKQLQQTSKLLGVKVQEIISFSAETHTGREAAWSRILQ